MARIKNIIFDLGGVLLDLDYQRTTRAFIDLGVDDFESRFNQFHADALFSKLETGKIPESEFYAQLQKSIPVPLSEKQIETAWNAMMLGFRAECLLTLQQLSTRFNLFLLSNTNSIHLRCFRELFTRDTRLKELDPFFSKCWYSHLIGLRKPGKEVYEFVLGDAGLDAEETLFIDDSIHNLEGANGVGIKTRLFESDDRIGELNWEGLTGKNFT